MRLFISLYSILYITFDIPLDNTVTATAEAGDRIHNTGNTVLQGIMEGIKQKTILGIYCFKGNSEITSKNNKVSSKRKHREKYREKLLFTVKYL